jgi:hypothetical protein
VMLTRIVVLFHIGKALDPVRTEPKGFVKHACRNGFPAVRRGIGLPSATAVRIQ